MTALLDWERRADPQWVLYLGVEARQACNIAREVAARLGAPAITIPARAFAPRNTCYASEGVLRPRRAPRPSANPRTQARNTCDTRTARWVQKGGACNRS